VKRTFAILSFFLLFLGLQSSANAQDTLIPAGTLIRCTLDEPNFSTATASVGDPVVCHLSSLQLYGRNVFPRGSYLGGHLEAAKEPGHFVGKGYLQLQFDRIGFPSSDIPVPSKVIAAKGYKVDKQGDIVGHGHATRDVVEWMIPPLWPWKILSLPARGPRPTLKGEEQITLRLMDDIVVPRTVAVNERPPVYYRQQSFDRLTPSHRPPAYTPRPAAGRSGDSAAASVSVASNSAESAGSAIAPASANVAAENTPAAAVPEAAPAAMTQASLVSTAAPVVTLTDIPQQLTLIAMKSGDLIAVASYRLHNENLNYLTAGGAQVSVDAREVDWRRTSQLNIHHPEVSLSTPVPHAY
jgi:hypothetical protein